MPKRKTTGKSPGWSDVAREASARARGAKWGGHPGSSAKSTATSAAKKPGKRSLTKAQNQRKGGIFDAWRHDPKHFPKPSASEARRTAKSDRPPADWGKRFDPAAQARRQAEIDRLNAPRKRKKK